MGYWYSNVYNSVTKIHTKWIKIDFIKKKLEKLIYIMSNIHIRIEDQLNIFDSDEEKVIYTADKFVEKKKKSTIIWLC